MKILVVDDDRSLVEALTLGLQLQWGEIEVLSAADGEQGVALFAAAAPDLTLLDVNMPRLNGWEALRQMRAISDAPLIMLSARGAEMDKVKGLSLGADDYLVKPFSHIELFARIKAVLRRNDHAALIDGRASFVSGDLAMNFNSREVTVAGQPVKLTSKEYNLLYLLVRNAGRILPIETLLGRVWGDEYSNRTGYLKTYMSRLRAKLGDSCAQPRYIATERGVGYRFLRLEAANRPAASAQLAAVSTGRTI